METVKEFVEPELRERLIRLFVESRPVKDMAGDFQMKVQLAG